MTNQITVSFIQQSETTTAAVIRDHSVLIDRPRSKNGTDLGPMGGELLLAALGGCFMSNLLAAVRARNADVTGIRATVVGSLAEAPTRFSAIDLRIEAACPDPALLHKLVTIAERGCLVAATLRPAVELTFTVAAEASQ